MKTAILVMLFLAGCSATVRKDTQTALDVAQIACVIANAESDDATVQAVCRIADELLPEVEKILAEQRAAARRYAREHIALCVDGGTHGAK